MSEVPPGFLASGATGSWLLPSSVLSRLSSHRIPDWVADLTGNDRGSSFQALENFRLPADPDIRDRLCRFSQQVLRQYIAILGDALAVEPPPKLIRVNLKNVPWSVRTRNCLNNEQLADDLDALLRVTFNQLLAMPNMGVRSAIDFAVTLESSLVAASQAAPTDRESQEHSKQKSEEIEGLLKALLLEPWSSLISSQDGRFKDLLLPHGKQTVAELADAALSDLNTSSASTFQLIATAEKIGARVSEIDAMPLEQQLREFFFQTLNIDEKRGVALLKRLGWLGIAPLTLEECGQSLGVTRERVRQLEQKFRNRIPTHSVFMPGLTKAISLIESRAPVKHSEMSRLLKKNRITTIDFSPVSLIAAADELHVSTKLQISTIGEDFFVTKTGNIPASRIISVARRISGAMGVCSAEQIVDAILSNNATSTESDRLALLEQVEKVLSFSKDLKSLGDGWYWAPSVPAKRNRLLNITNRILSAKDCVSIKKLREGVRRVYKFRNSSNNPWVQLRVPSSAVLKTFFLDHPLYLVSDADLVTCQTHLDYRAVLGDLEQSLVDIFRASANNILDRASIRTACAKRHLNMHSVEIALTYSPIIEHVDVNIWTIRGTEILPETVDAVRHANSLRPLNKRLQGYGWTAAGNAWIGIKVPDAVHNFVVGIPGSLLRFLRAQEFSIHSEDDTPRGKFSSSEDGVLYGFNRVLKEMGAEEGDVLIFEFNLVSSKVFLKVGDAELLREYEGNP
jgi:hypothetical protein